MSAAEVTFVGECVDHGWHGRTVCPACSVLGRVVLQVRSPISGSYRLAQVSSSLLRFRGGGREKCRQENRCRMCLRPRGPETLHEFEDEVARGLIHRLGSRPLTRHHLLPLWWFKRQPPPTRAVRSVDANIVPLCRICHDDVENEEEGRRMLRRVLGGDEVAFAIQLATEAWMDSRYPR